MPRAAIALVSVPELARELGMRPSRLYYYLDRLKVRTQAVGDATNSVRFIRRSDVQNIVQALNAYRTRRQLQLTTEQVAEQLGIRTSTVRTLASHGYLKASHTGRFLAFDPSDVDAYAKHRRPRRVA